MRRRGTLRHGLEVMCGLAAFAMAWPACAQQDGDFPDRPIRLVLPIAPGGGVDTMARTIGPLLSSRLGHPVVVDNRPGGGGSLGAELVAQAVPDGHTVMLSSSSFVIRTLLYPSNYDPVRDFAPVTQLVQHPYVLLVGARVPAADTGELIKLAKRGGVNFASSGNGSLIHLTGELFNSMTGVKMVHIPYKGLARAYPEMFSGEVQATFGSILSSLPHTTSGRLRALAVTSLTRTPRLPATPTLDEAGVKGFDVTQWYGVFAPAKTPAGRVERLQKEIAAILGAPEMAGRIASEGSRAVGNTSAEFGRTIQHETSKWRTIVSTAGIRAK